MSSSMNELTYSGHSHWLVSASSNCASLMCICVKVIVVCSILDMVLSIVEGAWDFKNVIANEYVL